MGTQKPILVFAPAKLNLTLDILGRRADGYHLLDMVMQTISVYDTLLLTPTEGQGVTLLCDRAGIPCGNSNTVQKAAEAFYRAAGIQNQGLQVNILKRIPEQAGMAGGSTDAAAVLRAMNSLYETKFTIEQLCEIGLTVGADVPFCLRGGTMRVGGIGEVFQPVPTLPSCFFTVCKPPISVSTADAFARVDTGAVVEYHTPNLIKALQEGDLSAIAAGLGNAFQQALVVPEVETLRKQMLQLGAMGSCMTGSGSAVFGIFPDRQGAETCRTALLQEYTQVFVCEPVSAE